MKKKKTSKRKFSSYNKSKDSINLKGIYCCPKRKKPKRIGKECINFKQDKLTCRLSKQFCKEAETCTFFQYKEDFYLHKTDDNESKVKYKKGNSSEVGITAIVLNNNRKCTNENHHIQDIQAKLRIALNPSGKIVNYNIPAAYCKICDAYFVLKKDFKRAKEYGVILCPVIDRTKIYATSFKAEYQIGNESRIHHLGYNVKKGNGLTDSQRHVVLANIVENTDISKYEITSNINRCISQHKKQPNYSESVKNWKNDLEFINNYELGDMPEVIINKVIIGKRR